MQMLSQVPPVVLPENYHEELMKKLHEEQAKEKVIPFSVEKQHKKMSQKHLGAIVAAAVVLLAVTSNYGFDRLLHLHDEKKELLPSSAMEKIAEPSEADSFSAQSQLPPTATLAEGDTLEGLTQESNSERSTAKEEYQAAANVPTDSLAKAVPSVESAPPPATQDKESPPTEDTPKEKEEEIPSTKDSSADTADTSEHSPLSLARTATIMEAQEKTTADHYIDLSLLVSAEDNLQSSVNDFCAKHQGILLDSNIDSAEGMITVELPSENVSAFLQSLSTIGTITEQQESSMGVENNTNEASALPASTTTIRIHFSSSKP